MSHLREEIDRAVHHVRETLSEDALISESRHQRRLHWILRLRNAAVAVAAVLFVLSLIHVPGSSILKAVAYFLGAAAYLGELLLLTDCFSHRIAHQELFMAYCFGPLYLLLGVSYLLDHLG